MTTAHSVVPFFYIYTEKRWIIEHKQYWQKCMRKEKTIHYKDQAGKKLQRILFPQKVNSVVAHTRRHYSITLS